MHDDRNEGSKISDVPFGNPHAVQLDGSNIIESFCALPNTRFSADDGSCAFASRRGGGKTHLLRKLFLEHKQSPSRPLTYYESTPLQTEILLHDLRKFDDMELRQRLKTVWDCVLALRVGALYLDAIERGVGGANRTEANEFASRIAHLAQLAGIRITKEKRTIALFSDVLQRMERRRGQKILDPEGFNPRDLVTLMQGYDVSGYIFLDDMDDSYAEAPRFWSINLSCLYMSIFHLRSQLPKIHIHTAIRREVFDYMISIDPNFVRVASQDNVKDIVWSPHDLADLLEHKIQHLPKSMRLFDDGAKSIIGSFFGLDNISNRYVNGVEESTLSYILRHTFHRARDLIVVGNYYWDLLGREQHRWHGAPSVRELEDVLRQGVRNAAGMIAAEVIADCDAVICDKSPSQVRRAEVCTRLIAHLGKNIVGREEMAKAKDTVADVIPCALVDPYDDLAYWGLIGWTDDREPGRVVQKFNFENSRSTRRVMRLPDSSHYFVHPALYECDEIRRALHISKETIVGHGLPAPNVNVGAIVNDEMIGPFKLEYDKKQLVGEAGSPMILQSREAALLCVLLKHASASCVGYVTLYNEVLALEYNSPPMRGLGNDGIRLKTARTELYKVVSQLRRKLKKRGVGRGDLLINTKKIGYRAGPAWRRQTPVTGLVRARRAASGDPGEI